MNFEGSKPLAFGLNVIAALVLLLFVVVFVGLSLRADAGRCEDYAQANEQNDAQPSCVAA